MPKKSLGFAALVTSLGIVGGLGAATVGAGTASAAPLARTAVHAAAVHETAVPQAVPQAVPAEASAPAAVATPHTYTVRPGDTLSALAARFGSTVTDIADANHIADVNLIYAGQVLSIASGATSSATRASTDEEDVSYHPAAASSSTSYQASSASPSGVWGCIARLESGSNPAENTGNGYYGMFQFSLPSWRAAGGQGNPAAASAAQQLAVAKRLQAMSGWGAWPVTSRACGV